MKMLFILMSLFYSVPIFGQIEKSNVQYPKIINHTMDTNTTTYSFKAVRRLLEAEQQLHSTPDKIFPLLCPTKEYDWIENWKCDLVYSKSGFAELDCIFKTAFPGEGEETWITDRIEPNKLIQFIRVSDLRVIRYSINLISNKNGSTTAKWEQTITALTEEGNQSVERYSNSDFEKLIRGLETMINHYLATGEMYRQSLLNLETK